MFRRVCKACALMGATAALILAADTLKPVCNAQSYGRMWPDTANNNPRLVTKLSHCGELQICGRSGWRYRWQSFTVRIDQLGHPKTKLATPSECDVSAEEIGPVVDPSQPANP